MLVLYSETSTHCWLPKLQNVMVLSTQKPTNPFNIIGYHILQEYAIMYNVLGVLYIQVNVLLVKIQYILRHAGIGGCINRKTCNMHNATTSHPMN